MAIDPQAQFVLDQLAESEAPPLNEMAPAEARAMYAEMAKALDAPDAPIGKVEDREIDGPGGALKLRLYTPVAAHTGNLPALVYFHGGGWVIGDLDTHDALCRTLANEAGCRVIAVDYRLAPEHPYPAALDDCYAATGWVEAQANALEIDRSRIAVGGDSAGGNLAAAVSLKARDEKGPHIAFQLLIYPVTDNLGGAPSRSKFAEGYLLEAATMDWFTQAYLPDAAMRTDPLASPIQAKELKGLPPAYVVTAGFDILQDEGGAYARDMEAAGVAVELRHYEGMIHGFFAMQGVLDVAKTAVRDAAAALKKALG